MGPATVRPVCPGIGIGYARGEQGTLGMLVRRADLAGVFCLSCSHVLAKCGAFDADDPPVNQCVVEQPLDKAVFDRSGNRIGVLTSIYTDFTRSREQSEDIALARLELPNFTNVPIGRTEPLRDPPILLPEQFEEGTPTILNGSVAKNAEGRILLSTRDPVDMAMPFVGVVTLRGLVPYATQCEGGDSGAAVIHGTDGTLLGMHIGGFTRQRLGYFLPLGTVFRNFQLRLA